MNNAETLKKKLSIDREHVAFAEKEEIVHGLTRFLKRKRIYVFDNHNHALFFRYQEYLRSHKICKVIHIDQHSDMNDNQHSLPDDLLENDRSREVFQFVQKWCNVGNFLQPALQS